MHLANPHSSVLASLGLAIQAGLLLGAAYIYARNLWFPIAIHFAWNFMQSGIFGVSTSGNSMGKSLLTTKINGAEWFTGGLFGPEGSIQATVFCLIAAVVLILMSHRQQKIARASWQRNWYIFNNTIIKHNLLWSNKVLNWSKKPGSCSTVRNWIGGQSVLQSPV